MITPTAEDIASLDRKQEEIQRELESINQFWIVPRFSWSSPWFWFEIRSCHLSSNLNLVLCTSLFGGWVEEHCHFENPLYAVFSGLSQQEIEIAQSVFISRMTTAIITFIGGYICKAHVLESNDLRSGNVRVFNRGLGSACLYKHVC